MGSKIHVTFWVRAIKAIYYPAKFGGPRHSGMGDIAKPCDQSVLRLYGLEPFQASYCSSKFDGHKH